MKEPLFCGPCLTRCSKGAPDLFGEHDADHLGGATEGFVKSGRLKVLQSRLQIFRCMTGALVSLMGENDHKREAASEPALALLQDLH